MNLEVTSKLYERLRSLPAPSSVGGSLPVLFFGNLFSARIATIGINPSWHEYLGPDKCELTGSRRRFETLNSLGAASRSELTDHQATMAINTMQKYFRLNGNAYSWFASYSRVVEGMGASFASGSAVHLDLVQESTYPTWRDMRRADPAQAETLLQRDAPFLLWQIDVFALSTIVCTSTTVWQTLRDMICANVTAQGDTGKRRWTVATAERNGRTLALAAWNIPLANAPGLTRDEQQQLGATISEAMRPITAAR